MSQFLRLLTEDDKATALRNVCTCLRNGGSDPRHFEVAPNAFDSVPGKPFAYWVSEQLRNMFQTFPALEMNGRTAKAGPSTADNDRFVRNWWEISGTSRSWVPFAKGGAYAPYYSDLHLVLNWSGDGREIRSFHKSVIRNPGFYFRPGLTWSTRTQIGLSFRVLFSGAIFSVKGSVVFVEGDRKEDSLSLLAILRSKAFCDLVSLQMAFGSYEVGVIQRTPVPELSTEQRTMLTGRALRAWSLKRSLDTIEETSHAFLIPAYLRTRLGDYDPLAIKGELTRLQAEIDAIAYDLYGFSEGDRAALGQPMEADTGDNAEEVEDEEDVDELSADTQSALLSWTAGVAFGRFDWRLATGERAAPPDPDPFDPLPAKSPGMLPDEAESFHDHPGILVDDQGHSHDLAHLVEDVLGRIDMSVPDDVRRWLQRDFFTFHLQRYSKSRRKAPIYWPLATASGSYTLWLYYPSLSSQTLYTAINDFVEPKLKEVGAGGTALRNKGGARSRDDEKQFENLQALEQELIELRDSLLKLAPTYKPNHDDGVQITAAPLWPLFRHKPWQKVLKDTWTKLEKGDYDWAHLAMSYWPERVRAKCKTDKSLAIAHGLEELYIEPPATQKKSRGKKKTEGEE